MKTGLILFPFILVTQAGFVKSENTYDSATIFHDPFQKPEFMQASVRAKTVDQASKPSWTPHLIMTLRAGKKSMANVGGQIIGLGEKIDGYKLIKVDERAVVFVNQGEITRLTLDED